MHKEHNWLANDFTHKDIIILETVYKINDTISGKFGEAMLNCGEIKEEI